MGFVHDRVKRYRTIATRKNARDRPVEAVIGVQADPSRTAARDWPMKELRDGASVGR